MHIRRPNNITIVGVTNYPPLQVVDGDGMDAVSELARLLEQQQFTHALVMEPHMEMMWKGAPAISTCNTTNPEQQQSLATQEYGGCFSDALWGLLKGRFRPGHLLHVVSWAVDAQYPITQTAANMTFSTRAVVDRAPCYTSLGGLGSTWASVSNATSDKDGPRAGSGHQCIAVCGQRNMTQCEIEKGSLEACGDSCQPGPVVGVTQEVLSRLLRRS